MRTARLSFTHYTVGRGNARARKATPVLEQRALGRRLATVAEVIGRSWQVGRRSERPTGATVVVQSVTTSREGPSVLCRSARPKANCD